MNPYLNFNIYPNNSETENKKTWLESETMIRVFSLDEKLFSLLSDDLIQIQMKIT
jgi:hypothetical protein